MPAAAGAGRQEGRLMSLFEFCIRRPVFATVLSLVLVLLGIVSYGRLTVREYPNVDEPVVSVSTSYPGASATIIESQITQVLEGSIAGIEGIDVLESTSRAETSRITVRFRSDVDPDVAASDVRDRVSRVRRRLPDEVEEPTIAKVEADAQAIMYLVFTSDRMNALEITDYVDRFVVDRLKNLNGVADVHDLRRAALCHAHLDRPRAAGRLQSHGPGRRERAAARRTSSCRPGASRAATANSPCCRAPGSSRRSSSATSSSSSPTAIRSSCGEVARVELGAADERRDSRYNGAARHRRRHHQAGGRQSARRVEGRARGAAGDQPVAAARA